MVVLEGVPGASGPILISGDFRYCPELLQSETLRRVVDGQRRCQRLCLDMSFGSRCTIEFPLKQDSIKSLLELIGRELPQRILLHTHGLGDEELLAAVAAKHGKLAFADAHRFHELKAVGFAALSLLGCCELLQDGPCPDHYRIIVVSGSLQVRQR